MIRRVRSRTPKTLVQAPKKPPVDREAVAAATIARYKAKITNPISAIRSHCVECMGGAVREIARCTASATCDLHPFRMGVNVRDQRSIEAKAKKAAKAAKEKRGDEQ